MSFIEKFSEISTNRAGEEFKTLNEPYWPNSERALTYQEPFFERVRKKINPKLAKEISHTEEAGALVYPLAKRSPLVKKAVLEWPDEQTAYNSLGDNRWNVNVFPAGGGMGYAPGGKGAPKASAGKGSAPGFMGNFTRAAMAKKVMKGKV